MSLLIFLALIPFAVFGIVVLGYIAFFGGMISLGAFYLGAASLWVLLRTVWNNAIVRVIGVIVLFYALIMLIATMTGH